MAQASGKSKRAAFTLCLKHGIERNGIRGYVRVSMPVGKKQRRDGGCPHCAREASQ